MQNYAAQDEILYHVGLSREMLKGAEYALLPGDPGRVEALAKALGPAQYLNTHREYTSWLAVVEGQNVLVCSTGMGGPSVAIGLEELARLINAPLPDDKSPFCAPPDGLTLMRVHYPEETFGDKKKIN